MQVFEFRSQSFQTELEPMPPLQAFDRSARVLEALAPWGPQQVLTLIAESVQLKEQLLHQVAKLQTKPDEESVRRLSLQSLAVGLLAGALDGMVVYRLGVPPDPFQVPATAVATVEQTFAYIQVANQDWRELEIDVLQLQAGYGKHLNRNTDQENVDFLAPAGKGLDDARRAFLETFRTGYSLGLIDSAIVCLHGQLPDRLE